MNESRARCRRNRQPRKISGAKAASSELIMMLDARVGNRDRSTRDWESALYCDVRKIDKTSLEIEVKLRITDLPGIVVKLKRLGAICHGRVREQNTLFDTADSAFHRSGRLLRVRIETAAPVNELPGGRMQAVLTSKAPPPDASMAPGKIRRRYKARAERELSLAAPAEFIHRLPSLGLRPGFRYEKLRTRFRYRGLHLDLDETPVGPFLELEGQPRAIDRAARALGFAQIDYIRETYWDLYAADCRRRGVAPKNMLLHARKSR
jgi:adenylate cyclase class 2